ncbi:MAG: 4-(cytidine 5'-diphospho)-2-C-methyl-D-erythritol kinase [Leptolyngbya sp. SIO4C5]|uniref:4-(cytidine 5'-diphospho)-2-C-methyl-D-erythritol kinase n=1 Tax=Sphaerothrix gracilis TaxID=3151835 RepID=UPI0013C1B64C|nr:4-(cytidine 5'-diphospho)-2-C-methyl-D-erythritol kinase [Leptolyngbya sp. SIO4C5]
MRLYSLRAAAKINLYLEIIGDRPDGFHELVMIMQSVALSDRITVRTIGVDEIRLQCSHPLVPTDETNLAYQAAALLAESFPSQIAKLGGVEIVIEKNIPVGAGLAGGSSNAAAVLVGLDLLWQLGLTQLELQDLGAKLGSDVPFCIMGGTAIATGRGEELDALTGSDQLHVVLAKYQNLAVSTPWAYKTYRQQFGDRYLNDPQKRQERQQRIHSSAMVAAISQRDSATIGQELCNDFERIVLPAYPQVAQLKETMAGLGGLGTLMSGSGPTVFTLLETAAAAEAFATELRQAIPDPDLGIWPTQFTPSSIQLEP